MNNFEQDRPETAMSEAFGTIGIRAPETPQQAAERIWKNTKHDPVMTMKRFDEWARQEPERMLAVLGHYWQRHVRSFLERNQQSEGAWRYSDSFRVTMGRRERKAHTEKSNALRPMREARLTSEEAVRARGVTQAKAREGYHRAKAGLKRIFADVDIHTGAVINLIDKEFGPFAHIRVGGMRLPEVTTEEALRYCDDKTADVRFVRALCQLIPDPRIPIGQQWTAEIIAEAKRAAA